MFGNFYYIACWLAVFDFNFQLNILSLFVKLQSCRANKTKHNTQHNKTKLSVLTNSGPGHDPIIEIISKVVTGLHYD